MHLGLIECTQEREREKRGAVTAAKSAKANNSCKEVSSDRDTLTVRRWRESSSVIPVIPGWSTAADKQLNLAALRQHWPHGWRNVPKWQMLLLSVDGVRAFFMTARKGKQSTTLCWDSCVFARSQMGEQSFARNYCKFCPWVTKRVSNSYRSAMWLYESLIAILWAWAASRFGIEKNPCCRKNAFQKKREITKEHEKKRRRLFCLFQEFRPD